MNLKAVIFDLDGVITDTAEFHYQAWQRLADEEGLPFDRQLNERLRGVSRAESLRIILGDRRVSPAKFQELLDRKNRYYQELLEELTPRHVLPGILPLLDELDAAGIRAAVGSASRNARHVLQRLGLLDRFAVLGDGHSVARAKPAPDLFLFIARQLNVSPSECIVVEDAQSGITAALRGGFWTAGIGPAERVGHAHIRFDHTGQLSLAALFGVEGWVVVEEAFDPHRLHAQETVFTIGNGYLGTRGTFEEGYPGEWRATFVHGLFDDVPTFFTELVNAPDWTHCQLFVNGERVRLNRGTVREYRRELSLQNGRLARRFVWQGQNGAEVLVEFQRTACRHDPHLLGVEVRVTALTREAEVEVRAGLPAFMDNLGWLHWDLVDQGADGDLVWLWARTRATRVDVGAAARLTADRPVEAQAWPAEGCPTLVARCRLPAGESVTLTKVAALATGRETDNPVAVVRQLVANAPADFNALLLPSAARWAELWAASDVHIEGDPEAQLAVRYNLFQLLAAGPERDLDASIGAKALSGYGYRGHVFWDTEIFMLPFFTYTQPEVARHLLLYRYRRLEGARRKAAKNGYEGAQFPWESADTGDEVTPTWVVDPADPTKLIRIWTGDIQIHITADVAHAVLLYWRVTGDDEFMAQYGAEIVVDGARFWASRAEYNEALDRYEYTDVIGPDEYHDHVHNNAFTNGMARWHLQQALAVLDWLAEQAPDRYADLVARLNLSPERLAQWREIADKIYLPVQPSGLVEQFDGYFGQEDVDLAALEPRHQSVQSLLGIEGVARTQVIKQPDVLMWLYLMREEPFVTPDVLRVNWDYYNPRTDHTHGSSLGPAIMAALAARMGQAEEAYQHFMRAALVDLRDLRHNTADGIHAASAGGVWQALVFGFAGVRLTPDGPTVEQPCLPPGWRRLRFRLCYRGRWFDFDVAAAEGRGERPPSPRGERNET